MVGNTSVIKNASDEVNVPPNVLGFTIEPTSNNTDNFKVGINEDPKIPFLPGDGSRDFGFTIGPTGKGEFYKPATIKIEFEMGAGTVQEALIIWTIYEADDCPV